MSTPECTITGTSISLIGPRKPSIRVFTNASEVGIRAILQQQINNEWHTVEYFSKKLKGAECNYSATDRELLAINEAVTKYWHHRLLDRQFELHTDHMPYV